MFIGMELEKVSHWNGLQVVDLHVVGFQEHATLGQRLGLELLHPLAGDAASVSDLL